MLQSEQKIEVKVKFRKWEKPVGSNTPQQDMGQTCSKGWGFVPKS